MGFLLTGTSSYILAIKLKALNNAICNLVIDGEISSDLAAIMAQIM